MKNQKKLEELEPVKYDNRFTVNDTDYEEKKKKLKEDRQALLKKICNTMLDEAKDDVTLNRFVSNNGTEIMNVLKECIGFTNPELSKKFVLIITEDKEFLKEKTIISDEMKFDSRILHFTDAANNTIGKSLMVNGNMKLHKTKIVEIEPIINSDIVGVVRQEHNSNFSDEILIDSIVLVLKDYKTVCTNRQGQILISAARTIIDIIG